MAARVRGFDWGATALGPAEGWPERLLGAVEAMLAAPMLATLAVGPERVFLYNDAAAGQYGDRHPDVLGQPLGQAFPQEFGKVAGFYDQVFAGESLHVPAQPLDPAGSGTAEVFDAYLTPVRDAGGAVIAAAMTGFAIGARLRAEAALAASEERQAFLLRLSDALRPLSDPEDIRLRAAALLGRHLGANRVAYAEHVGDAFFEVRRNYVDGAAEVTGRFRYADYGHDILAELQAGRTRVQPDIAGDPRLGGAEKRALADAQVGASLNVPLVKDGRLVAFLGVNYPAAHDFSAFEIDLVAEVAERTWAAVEWARAEAALRESEARLAAAFESVPVGVAAVDLSGAAVVSNAGYRRFLPSGIIPSRDPERGGRWRGWDPAGRPLARRDFPAARAMRGETVVPGQEMLYTDDDGREIWTSVATAPTHDDQGRVTGVVTAIADIDIAKRSSEALGRVEEQQRLTLELVPAMLWWADPVGDRIETTPQWTGYTGQTEDETHGFGWLAAIHPDDLPGTRAAFEHAFATGEPLERQQRVRKAGDGYRWHLVRHVPVRDAAGRIVRWFGAAIDVHDLHLLQDHQQLLLAELQHRVRNILTVVRSVFARTVEAGGDVEDVADHFRGRLDSLARTQVIVTGSASGFADLHTIVGDELLSVGAANSPDVTVEGPDVALPPAAAESIGLAIHELTTNALKYGALRGSGGKLYIGWDVNVSYGMGRRLVLTWTEQGVPAVAVRPTRHGFGRELIEEALPYRLGAETHLEFRGGGVRCVINVPLPDAGASAADAWKGD